uniref:Putative lambda recombination protein n=1 Tax=viral metagenome TaxID=1070528 RepID=A0A6H1ZPX5_9ZZZZ
MKRATANGYLSHYILLRDALPPDYEWCRCCTCGKLIRRLDRNCHAGHFVTKGHGGSSGVYWDERNIHAQCNNCNRWQEGNQVEYYPFMLEKYGQAVIDELRLKHRLPRPNSIDEYGIYYREAYKELKKKLGVTK